jgi:hypothetical protein
MGEERPIGARNIAAPQRLFPQRRHRGGILGLGELIDCKPVDTVERLLQLHSSRLGAAREQHPQNVQIVLVGRLDAADL